jgi:truncated hemoglobin YjbI
MGGPASYSNAALREAHSHLHIDDRAFDEMIGLFKAMLEDCKIAEDDLVTIMAELNAHRAHIVRARMKL